MSTDSERPTYPPDLEKAIDAFGRNRRKSSATPNSSQQTRDEKREKDTPIDTLSKLATQLSKRIAAFQDLLNSLDGQIETFLPFAHINSPVNFGTWYLWFTRSSKKWVLLVGSSGTNEFPPDEAFELLTEASLETKMSAVKVFPHFWKKLEGERQQLLARLSESNSGLDKFFHSIGFVVGEGE